MARFAQYAMVASAEALADAGWTPQKEHDLQATVGRLVYGRIFPLIQH
jgi:3-oxoacyl-(acyl-carrier-protein) synthase